MNRAELGWAIFLSAPVGAGVWLAVLKTSGGLDEFTAAVAGIAAALAVFLIALGGLIDWSGEYEPDGRD